MKLAIIGTAGRKDDADLLTLDKWKEMKRVIARFVEERNILSAISGGAAYADHLAVGLYNADYIENLELALPCAYDLDNIMFVDNGDKDWRKNPGKTCNYYHRQFSEKVGINSLLQIKDAIISGAIVKIEDGFFARNSLVAEADILIAFTFGEGAKLKDGGTADTTKKFLNKHNSSLAYHYDLNSMTLYQNALT